MQIMILDMVVNWTELIKKRVAQNNSTFSIGNLLILIDMVYWGY